MKDIQNSILLTVVYADIFDCCLLEKELSEKLHTDKKYSAKQIKKNIEILDDKKKIKVIDNFICLPGKVGLVELRKKRLVEYKKKMDNVHTLIRIVKKIPWISAVVVTGSVGAKNCDENDDIDVMIICEKNRLWLCRFWLIVESEILNIRRRPKDTDVKNLFCFNMFLEEDRLKILKGNQNIYTANEVIQTKFIYDRFELEKVFFDENMWINEYVNNYEWKGKSSEKINRNGQNKSMDKTFLKYVFNWLNDLTFALQYLYMRPKKTTEIVNKNTALFHPRPTRINVLTQFLSRKKRFGLV